MNLKEYKTRKMQEPEFADAYGELLLMLEYRGTLARRSYLKKPE